MAALLGLAGLEAQERGAEVPGRWGLPVLPVDGEAQSTGSPVPWLPARSPVAVLCWEERAPQRCAVLPTAGGPGWDRARLCCAAPFLVSISAPLCSS